jgi:hypothetical protein
MIRNIFIHPVLCVFSAIDSFAGPEAEFKKVLISWNVLENGSVEMNYCKELNLHTHNSFNNLYGEHSSSMILYTVGQSEKSIRFRQTVT